MDSEHRCLSCATKSESSMIGPRLITSDVEQLEFADFGFAGCRKNIQSDFGCADCGECIDSLMSDGAPFLNGLPGVPLPDLDAVMLDALTIIEPLHDQRVIECHWLGEGYFNAGMMRARRRGPERCRITVQCRVYCSIVNVTSHQVLAVTLPDRLTELAQPLHIAFRH